jgi:hypothetical protein
MHILRDARQAVVAALLLLPLAVGGPRRADAQPNQSFVVIVNAASPLQSMTREQVSNVFLKKPIALPGGMRAMPVDLDGRNRIRSEFSQSIHRKSMVAVGNYWKQQIFAGKEVPPPAMASENDIVTFVRGSPDAIGYVSADHPLGAGIRILRIEE